MKTIALVSQKGGSGKTTMAINLAVAAVKSAQRTVILDLDPQGSAVAWSQERESRGLGDPVALPVNPSSINGLLKECRQSVDIVIIDTAPRSDNAVYSVLKAADVILVPCRLSLLDLAAIPNTLSLATSVGVSPTVVLSQCEPNIERCREFSQNLAKMNVSFCHSGTGRRVSYVDALASGQGVVEYAPRSKAALEITSLYDSVIHGNNVKLLGAA